MINKKSIGKSLLRMMGVAPRRTVLDYVIVNTGYFFAGALVGSVTSLFLAPKSGREMRHDISDNVSNLRDSLGQRAEDVIGKVKAHLPSPAASQDWENSRARRTTVRAS